MLPKPQVGQKVRLDDHEEQFIIRSVSDDGGEVSVVSVLNPDQVLEHIPCLDLLLTEGDPD
jgi:hypothetical protein